jgi:hypothetical protein
MNYIFIISGIISLVFFIAKFIEMRFIEKESKPLKFLIRDSLLVYFSVIVGYFISDQLKTVAQSGGESSKSIQVFTDNPEF